MEIYIGISSFLGGIQLDIYIATKETWATLLLIRTGSAAYNIMLCSRAIKQGKKLFASGSGLFLLNKQNQSIRIGGDSEKSIFVGLGMNYVQPENREVKMRG